MAREFDARSTRTAALRVTDDRVTELRAIAAATSDALPGSHRVAVASFDAATGNPSLVVSHDAGTTSPDAYVDRASAHLRALAPVLGLKVTADREYRVDPKVAVTSTGAAAVHAQQEYKGILVFQASEVVRFTPSGILESTVGQSVTIDRDQSPVPTLSSAEAAVTAARFVAAPTEDELSGTDQFGEPRHARPVDVSGFAPKIVSQESGADQRTLLQGDPLSGRTSACLTWFALGADLRLTWQIILTLPTTEQWRVLVDAREGNVLYSHRLTLDVVARGNVYLPDGSAARQMLDFPRPLGSYGLPNPGVLPALFPRDWVSAGRTEGNAANGHLGDDGVSTEGSVVNGVLTFDPANATGDDQKVLNIFFLSNYMHDYLYLLGFREADGNFQQDNFGLGGLTPDRVDARAHSGEVDGTANWSPTADGEAPVMNMGLLTRTNRHTAFDSSVVFHEYTHGLTVRLVGGAVNAASLDAFQSGSMGEGWSDYIACTINNTVVVGAWLVNDAAGIRGFPYDTNFPDHYGRLGTGRYNEVHNNGEIWCAALMEMNRRIGATLAVQCVVDGLKLTPANPTYLQGRDGIIAALVHRADTERWTAIERRNRLRGAWTAFARFGMGLHAKSGASTTTNGIVADFSIPAELNTAGPWAGNFDGSGKADVLFNKVDDGDWWLGTFANGKLGFASVANTLGFGDLADGAHLSWVGDFTGSGKTEVLFNYVGDGNWWLGRVAGSQLSFAKVGNTAGFGNLADGAHPSWVGDFTGSGKTEVLFNYVGDGNWWLGRVAGNQLSFTKVGNTIGFGNLADGAHPSWVGDFTGSGKTEVLFNYVGDGNWWLGRVAGNQLSFTKVGNTAGFGNLADGAHPSWIGDFTGSGKTQILFNYVGDGNWWLGTFSAGQLAFAKVGNTLGFGNLADGKHPSWVGDFTGSTNTDLLFNYVGDGNWWLGTFAAGQLSFAKVGNTIGFGDLADGVHPSWVGDFVGSGKREVLFNYFGDGNWWLGTFTGGQLTFAKVATK